MKFFTQKIEIKAVYLQVYSAESNKINSNIRI